MYLIDGKQIELSELSPYNEKIHLYNGNDPIKSLIFSKWKEFKEKYTDKGEYYITFICHSVKNGKRGRGIPRSIPYRTKLGTPSVTWCDSAVQTAPGVYNILPRRYLIDWGSKTLNLEMDIEEILFLSIFAQTLFKEKFTYPAKRIDGTPHPKAGEQHDALEILDRTKEAEKFLSVGARNADVWFYLNSPTSPIIGNVEVINLLASAFGVIRPETKSNAIVRQELIQTIESNERAGNKEYGYSGFSQKIKDIIEDKLDETVTIMAKINQAIDRGIIKYAAQRLSWFLLGENGNEISKICTIPPTESEHSKEFLVGFLQRNQEELYKIEGGIEEKPLEPMVIKQVYIPDNPTKKYFEEEMKYPKMKTACTILYSITRDKKYQSSHEKTKEELVSLLIDYFITKGLTIPDENKLLSP